MTDFKTTPLSNTIPEVVARTGCSRTGLYEAIRRGELPIMKIRHKTLILETDLKRWLHRHRLRREAA
jgi:excisionase family DNA binding protein